jgi:hypothetical protein
MTDDAHGAVPHSYVARRVGTSDGQQTESCRHNDEMLCTVNIKFTLGVS